MTNAEYLYNKGKLNAFLYRFAEMKSSADVGEFCRYYGIDEENIDIAKWLVSEHEEKSVAVGTRVRGCTEEFTLYGTVKVSAIKNGENRVFVEWDGIKPFAAHGIMGKNVFEAEENETESNT